MKMWVTPTQNSKHVEHVVVPAMPLADDPDPNGLWVHHYNLFDIIFTLTHWGGNKILVISQTTISNACSWMKIS